MRTIKVKEGQTLLDIALEHCGDVSAAFAIADANGLSVTDDLAAGQTLIVPEVSDAQIVGLFETPYLTPASSSDDEEEQVSAGEGLGYWMIGVDFIIT